MSSERSAEGLHRLKIGVEARGQRLDRFVEALELFSSRAQIKQAIGRGAIRVDGQGVKAGYRLRVGAVVEIEIKAPPQNPLLAQAIPLEILFEDEALIVLVKPVDMVVHPAPGHERDTLVNALLHHCGPELHQVGAAGRPGIVHRLDRQTSGVMVVAKTLQAHAGLAERFACHDIERSYWALCHAPQLADEGRFDTLHGRHHKDRKRFSSRVERGRRAITHYRVLERFEQGAALVRCQLETGRTHQVRVHLSEHGAPLLGDSVYSGRAAANSRLIQRVALHARTLSFTHPLSHEKLHFDSPPPSDFTAALEALRAGKSWR